MQHAVKYRLVPEAILNSTVASAAPPRVDKLEEMRRELITLLDDPHIERFKKQALFEALHHQFNTIREHLSDPIARRSPPPALPQPPSDVVSAPRVRKPIKPKPVKRQLRPKKVADDLRTAVEIDLRTARDEDSDSDLSTVTAINEADEASTQESAEEGDVIERIRKKQRKVAKILEAADVPASASRRSEPKRSHKRPRQAHKKVGTYREPKTWKEYAKRAQKGKGGVRFTVRKWTVS